MRWSISGDPSAEKIPTSPIGRETVDGWRMLSSSGLEDDVANPTVSRIFGGTNNQHNDGHIKERKWPNFFSSTGTHHRSQHHNHQEEEEESVELYVSYVSDEEENKLKLKSPIAFFDMNALEQGDDKSAERGIEENDNKTSELPPPPPITKEESKSIVSPPSENDDKRQDVSARIEKYVVARLGAMPLECTKGIVSQSDDHFSLDECASSQHSPRSLSSTRSKHRSAEYAFEMLMRAEKVDEAVENTACDERNATAASKRTDVLAARAPMKLRKLAERAAAVARQDPRALVHLLKHDPNEHTLQEAFDALRNAADIAQLWLGFAPMKRGYAVSRHAQQISNDLPHHTLNATSPSNSAPPDGNARAKHSWTNWSPAQPLAVKYETRLSDAFRRVESALEHLDALRGRLPTTARLVRFASAADVWLRQPSLEKTPAELTDDKKPLNPKQEKTSSSTEDNDELYSHRNSDLESSKFTAHEIDDFLTDAAPLGVGVMSSDVYACRDRNGTLFLTSNYKVADDLLRDTGMDTLRLRRNGGVYNCDPDDDNDDDEATTSHIVDFGIHESIDHDDNFSDQERATSIGRRSSTSSGPAVLATTTLYKCIDDPRQFALDEGDEIWATTIDNHEYFFCVLADHSDRGLRHACHTVGVSDSTLDDLSILFRQVE